MNPLLLTCLWFFPGGSRRSGASNIASFDCGAEEQCMNKTDYLYSLT